MKRDSLFATLTAAGLVFGCILAADAQQQQNNAGAQRRGQARAQQPQQRNQAGAQRNQPGAQNDRPGAQQRNQNQPGAQIDIADQPGTGGQTPFGGGSILLVLDQIVNQPVVDSQGEPLGEIVDLLISTNTSASTSSTIPTPRGEGGAATPIPTPRGGAAGTDAGQQPGANTPGTGTDANQQTGRAGGGQAATDTGAAGEAAGNAGEGNAAGGRANANLGTQTGAGQFGGSFAQQFALVSFSNFADSGRVAVIPWDLLTYQDGQFVFNVQADRISQLPSVQRNDPRLMQGTDWIGDVNSFFEDDLRQIRAGRPDLDRNPDAEAGGGIDTDASTPGVQTPLQRQQQLQQQQRQRRQQQQLQNRQQQQQPGTRPGTRNNPANRGTQAPATPRSGAQQPNVPQGGANNR